MKSATLSKVGIHVKFAYLLYEQINLHVVVRLDVVMLC